VRFKVLTAASMKFRIIWDVVLCSHIEVDFNVITRFLPQIKHVSVTRINWLMLFREIAAV
jgi:hypothetical protein